MTIIITKKKKDFKKRERERESKEREREKEVYGVRILATIIKFSEQLCFTLN